MINFDGFFFPLDHITAILIVQQFTKGPHIVPLTSETMYGTDCDIIRALV